MYAQSGRRDTLLYRRSKRKHVILHMVFLVLSWQVGNRRLWRVGHWPLL